MLLNKSNKVFDLYEEGFIDKKQLTQRLEKFGLKDKEINKEIHNLGIEIDKIKVPVGDSKSIKLIMKDIGRLLEDANPVEKKALLRLVIEEIQVKDKKISNVKLRISSITGEILTGELSDNDSSPFFVFEYEIKGD